MFRLAFLFVFIIFIAEAKRVYVPRDPPLVEVNHIRLQAEPLYLSEADYLAEYQYEDGEEVAVRCYDIITDREHITMEYAVADTFSDIFNTKSLPLGGAWGFVTKLYSGHNNSYMICNDKEKGVKLMVKFIMRTEFGLVSVNIDGITLPQKMKKRRTKVHTYLVQYQHYLPRWNDRQINVVCEVKQEDLQLEVGDNDFRNLTNYKKTELITSKKVEISLNLACSENRELTCSANNTSGKTAEAVIITFHIIQSYKSLLHLELPANGTVMELYSIYNNCYKLKIVFYEFEAGEILQLNCKFQVHQYLYDIYDAYLKSDDSETCNHRNCIISKQLNLTLSDDNRKYSFYVLLRGWDMGNYTLGAEIRVIFRMRNKTDLWQSHYQKRKDKVAVIPESVATKKDHTTTIIVSVAATVGGVLVLCALGFLILRLKRRYDIDYERQLQARIAANIAPAFYLNLMLRDDCDRQLAEIDQHIYEEIGPPIYEEINDREYEEIDEPDYEEIDVSMNAENNGPVCEERVAPVSEEIHALVHENTDGSMREEINSPVHEEINTSVHEEINMPVQEEISTSMHEEINTPVHEEINTSLCDGPDSPICEVTDGDE